jgi:hypothetical protein
MSKPANRPTLYKGYRFPPEIISHGVSLYYRFRVSLRDVSELMLARGIEVSHEAIRLWTLRFGLEYASRLRRTRGVCSNCYFFPLPDLDNTYRQLLQPDVEHLAIRAEQKYKLDSGALGRVLRYPDSN